MMPTANKIEDYLQIMNLLSVFFLYKPCIYQSQLKQINMQKGSFNPYPAVFLIHAMYHTISPHL